MTSAVEPLVLGYAPMDAVHLEFQALVAQACKCSDTDLLAGLERLATHLQEHFAAEDDWMRSTAFPASDCHLQEHAAVLRSAHEVLQRVASGDHKTGRAFAAELVRWFPGHADYLDSALAAWMCMRNFGGKPVVLHKSKPASSC